MKYFLIIFLILILLPEKASAMELKGNASYYSVAGCLGCSPTLTMANGERLNDKKLTLALMPTTVQKYDLLNEFLSFTEQIEE